MKFAGQMTNAELAAALNEMAVEMRPTMHPKKTLLREAASRLQAPAVAEVDREALVDAYLLGEFYDMDRDSYEGISEEKFLREARSDYPEHVAAGESVADRIRSALRTGGSE